MTINKLVQELAKREGLKKQVDIAQMKEIVGHLSDMVYAELYDLNSPFVSMINDMPTITSALYRNGEKRAKKKAKKKKKCAYS